MTAEQIVFTANDRCDQEHLLAQLSAARAGGQPAVERRHAQPGMEPFACCKPMTDATTPACADPLAGAPTQPRTETGQNPAGGMLV